MTKEEIQKRLLKDGKPLSMDLFAWDESTKTFKTNEDDVVIDFSGIDYCTIKCGNYCTIICGRSCTIKCRDYCICVRRDIFEFFEIPAGKEIKLNPYDEKGYSFVEEKHIITIDGKNIELSKESYDNLKKQLNGE